MTARLRRRKLFIVSEILLTSRKKLKGIEWELDLWNYTFFVIDSYWVAMIERKKCNYAAVIEKKELWDNETVWFRKNKKGERGRENEILNRETALGVIVKIDVVRERVEHSCLREWVWEFVDVCVGVSVGVSVCLCVCLCVSDRKEGERRHRLSPTTWSWS